jgi:hypothetical protein
VAWCELQQVWQPHLHGIIVCSLHGSSLLGWLYFLPIASWYVSGISNILGFSLQLGLNPHSFTHCSSDAPWRKGIQHYHKFAWLTQAFLWNLGGNLHDHVTLTFCILGKTSITWIMLTSATRLSNSPAPLDHSCSGLWVPRQLNLVKGILGKQLLRWPWVAGGPEVLSSIRVFFKWVYHIISLSLINGIWPILDMPSRHLSYCP